MKVKGNMSKAKGHPRHITTISSTKIVQPNGKQSGKQEKRRITFPLRKYIRKVEEAGLACLNSVTCRKFKFKFSTAASKKLLHHHFSFLR